MKLVSLSCWILAATTLTATELQTAAIIERARASVGAEAVLEGVVTLKIEGTIRPSDPELPDARVFLIARKPCSQRLEVHLKNFVETTILQGQSGCIIRFNPESSESYCEFRRMTVEEIRRMQFNTRQLFNFYREDSANDESVQFECVEQRRGIKCSKLVYSQPDGISTTRYFSVDDGRLVSVVTDKGVESVDLGSREVAGIRFPERIDYYQGDKHLHTFILEAIEVNKPLQAGIFSIPSVPETK